MKALLLAAAVAGLLPLTSYAQSSDELINGANDTGNVLNYGMGYNLQRYSPLTQINKQTVRHLTPVWNYSYDDNRSEESQPLVYKGVLYVSTHAATMAIDVKSGRAIWKTKVEYPPETPRIVCCGIISRGVALYDGKVYRTTLDAHVVALDAKTGKEVWNSKVIDWHDGYSQTLAPLIADGVVITGISGAEYGIRGFLDGWDPQTGNHLWRTYTIPGPGEPGNDTWPGDTWKHGGGSTWITGSYDPELKSVFWGVGNAGSWNAMTHPGDNLYTCSILSLDPHTGKIKWHFQFTPNDPYDYDSVAEMILATLNINGQPTKVVMDANRNGFYYVFDRATGEMLKVNKYGKTINWASGIDEKTGRPIESELSLHMRATSEETEIWPSVFGSKNWGPSSFNPNTGLIYANTLEFGMKYKPTTPEFRAGTTYWGADIKWVFPKDRNVGYLKAIDPLSGETKWEAPSGVPRFGGTMTTAGGLVFTGKETGEFEAFDADNGKKLWQFQTGSGIEGQPVTWEQDGVQYVAVSVGLGGGYALYSGDDRLANIPAGGSLWVFALPQETAAN